MSGCGTRRRHQRAGRYGRHFWQAVVDLRQRGWPVAALAERLTGCEYVHETRELAADGSRLTDHSGLAVRLALTATGALLTSDPATAATPAEPETTLF